MKILVSVLLALGIATTATAQEIKHLSYYADLSNPDDLSPALIGGTVADPADWPASPWIGNCSSTLISDRWLLTAAHCVSNGGQKSFTLGSTRFIGTCTHHPQYRGNAEADWALCRLTQPVSGIQFEVIATEAEAACSVGIKYLWSGYGCQIWGGALDGKFRTGLVAVTQCPSGASRHDIVTRGSTALCSGDSGGGGYALLASGERRVVGVNSRSNTRDTSYVSNTFGQTFRSWAKSLADAAGDLICGIHAGAKSCRGSKAPDPDPKPSCESELASALSAQTAASSALTSLKVCLEK